MGNIAAVSLTHTDTHTHTHTMLSPVTLPSTSSPLLDCENKHYLEIKPLKPPVLLCCCDTIDEQLHQALTFTGTKTSSLQKINPSCVVHTERRGQARMLELDPEDIWWLCSALGSCLLAWFVSTCPLNVWGHCKSIQSCYERRPLSCDETLVSHREGSRPGWWSHIHRAWVCVCVGGGGGITVSLNGPMSMKMMGIAPMGDFQPMCNTELSTTDMKRANEAISFGWLLIMSLEWRLSEWMPGCTEAALAAYGGPTPN